MCPPNLDLEYLGSKYKELIVRNRLAVVFPGTSGVIRDEKSATRESSSGLFQFQFDRYEILFREFEEINNILFNADMPLIMAKTGCKTPCSYKEYNFANPNLKEYSINADDPATSVAFCLWSVSNHTLIEEESLVLSLQSLISDFGGSLGLFLGFSFMTIWDGVKLSAMYLKNFNQVSRIEAQTQNPQKM